MKILLNILQKFLYVHELKVPMKIVPYLTLFSIGVLSVIFTNSFIANGQVSHGGLKDSTPIAAITTITKNETGKPIFSPSKVYIKEGQELLILNNLTSTQTFTNEKVMRDPVGGKLFSVDIKPHNFAEYSASLPPGTYPFHSKHNLNIRGELIIQPR